MMLDQAKSIGADIVFNSQKNDVDHEIKKFFPNGAAILVDAVGVPSLINNNLKLVKYSGQICVYGFAPIFSV
jgi:threonine dehydrogenase-like Zn-dependent dehydrogenase